MSSAQGQLNHKEAFKQLCSGCAKKTVKGAPLILFWKGVTARAASELKVIGTEDACKALIRDNCSDFEYNDIQPLRIKGDNENAPVYSFINRILIPPVYLAFFQAFSGPYVIKSLHEPMFLTKREDS